jgi:hypothetical protein
MYVLVTSALDPTFNQPTIWREAGRFGNEPAAVKAAAALRDDSHAARIFHASDYELAQLLMDAHVVRDAPRVLYGVAILDPTGTHSVLHEQGCMSEAEANALAQRLSASLNVIVITSSGNR